MEKITKIAIMGGTGKSGKYLVNQLLNQGYHLKLLLRNPDNFQIQNPLIEIIKGDARDYNSVHTLLDGCQAVMSTLGQPKGEGSIFSAATRNVIRTMHECHINRYILTTGLNVDTPFDRKGSKSKLATDWMKTNYLETTADKQVEYEALVQSDTDWTLVRLPLIELTDEKGKIAVNLEDCPGEKINATDLADFLIEQLTDDKYLQKSPFIASI